MSERTSRINVKLDIPKSVIDYYRLQERWENEGGAISIQSIDSLVPGDFIPFAPGESFKVLHASIDLIDDQFYCIADIQKVINKNKDMQVSSSEVKIVE